MWTCCDVERSDDVVSCELCGKLRFQGTRQDEHQPVRAFLQALHYHGEFEEYNETDMRSVNNYLRWCLSFAPTFDESKDLFERLETGDAPYMELLEFLSIIHQLTIHVIVVGAQLETSIIGDDDRLTVIMVKSDNSWMFIPVPKQGQRF